MKRISAVLGVLGVSLFVLVAAKVGWSGVIRQLLTVRLGLLILIGLSFSRLALQTVAWSIALRAQGVPASIAELIGVRLASQAVGYLSVLGPAISEPMKLRLLLKYREPGAVATLADAGAYGFSACLFGIAACGAVVAGGGRHLVSALSLATGLLAGFLLLLRSKPILAAFVRRLGARSPAWLKYGEQIEIGARKFWRENPSATGRMFWLDLGCQVLFVGDIIAILWCLRLPLHIATVMALEVASRAARMIAGWMPARIGVDEAGAAAAFVAFGLPSSSGIALALARRLRDLLCCVLGISWLLLRREQ